MQDVAVKKGKLDVICGSMFSGKSEELIRRLRRAKIARKSVIAFKHSFDVRTLIEESNDFVISHNGNSINAFPIDNAETLLQKLRDLSEKTTHTNKQEQNSASAVAHSSEITSSEITNFEIIGIDEIQFFSSEIIPVIINLLDAGKHVIVAGLNLDFRALPFGPIATLMALADDVTKLSAICVICGDDAYFTQRIINNSPAKFDDPVIQVGAQEAYQARCRNCFIIDKKPTSYLEL